jgi:CheY-like chemotaxis protein
VRSRDADDIQRKLRRTEARLRSAEAALAAAREAADTAGRAQAHFLALMSHEIRTPLNGIIGMTALMLDSAGEPKPAGEDRQSLSVILQSGEHLLQLLNDILDFSRLDSGQFRLEEAAFDVRTTIASAVALMQAQAQRKGLALSLEFAHEVPLRAGGDAGRLRQVLLNLIGNAIKFTEHGSVRVAVGCWPPQDGTVLLTCSVTDTGIGINAAALARVFEEFTQADNSISRRFGGSGLGLAISRRLVAEMGGVLSAQSTPGEGSVFRFEVRLRARRASDLATPVPGPVEASDAPVSAIPLGPQRVLVAEDNATNRLVVMRMLERLGHVVSAVTNGREAVTAVQSGEFDVVLMDVMMPELDGLAATAEIRALPGPLAHLPIIGLTANAEPSDASACREAGMNGFATKPISRERLAQAMREALVPQLAPVAMIEDVPIAVPAATENRLFDPAVLDVLMRTGGKAAASAAIAGFLDRSVASISRLRGQPSLNDARAIADEAASFGLMRAGRAGAVLTADAGPEAFAEFAQILSQSVEELRSWRRLALW